MQHAKILDCTLRDGAYLVDKEFGNKTIKGIIHGLIHAKIDIIEMGFLQNEGFGEGKTVYRNCADASKFISEEKGNTQIALLADYSRYSIENLDEKKDGKIDIVRACFFKHERFDAIEFCKTIKKKGYKLFVQPVDIMGYSDKELIELIELINEIEPYCFSIVDTFGSMYQDDLQHVYSICSFNLVPSCKIGFHSHNNMQMSSALSQEFLKMSYGNREVVVDTTVFGMGRGAGNTPTELISQYMVKKMGYQYDIDAILDIADQYIDSIRSRCTWGYSIPYFIAGSYSAHVNNISYLNKKSGIRSKDIRYILNKIGADKRKRYEYDVLEKTYVDYLGSNIIDNDSLQEIGKSLSERNVLIIAPGNTANENFEQIESYIKEKNAITISINFVYDKYKTDYLYFNNVRRYEYWNQTENFAEYSKIITSNIQGAENALVVSFNKLVKCGWEHLDNSTMMLLRLLDQFDINSIGIAGFDGYSINVGAMNYAQRDMEVSREREDFLVTNYEIEEMLVDYMKTRNRRCEIEFVTPSRFSRCIDRYE